jgi:3-oxoacyl-[acyl-carrier protein] reductase
MDLAIEGRRALVTGSYRGTGSAIAEALAREGARVLVHGLEDGQPDEVVARLRADGLDVEGVVGDIRNDLGSQQLLERVGSDIDILINNYGVAEGGSWSSPTDDWIDIYQKNVLSGVRLAQGLAPAMKQREWGRIIWLGTIGSTRPNSRMPHYYASKATLPNVCVSLSKELAGSGITVNLVSPGMIATKEVVALMQARARKKGWGDDWEVVQQKALDEMFPNPTGRLAEVAEVARLVTFIASEHAGYINGANIRIDGGATDCAI